MCIKLFSLFDRLAGRVKFLSSVHKAGLSGAMECKMASIDVLHIQEGGFVSFFDQPGRHLASHCSLGSCFRLPNQKQAAAYGNSRQHRIRKKLSKFFVKTTYRRKMSGALICFFLKIKLENIRVIRVTCKTLKLKGKGTISQRALQKKSQRSGRTRKYLELN